MKKLNITVVTCVELGWDCVVGVYHGDEDYARERFNEAIGEPIDAEICDTYIFHSNTLKVTEG